MIACPLLAWAVASGMMPKYDSRSVLTVSNEDDLQAACMHTFNLTLNPNLNPNLNLNLNLCLTRLRSSIKSRIKSKKS